MGSNAEMPPRPWVETPCIHSTALSRTAGCNIFLKLENLQPSASFKSRGIGNLMSLAIEQHGLEKPIHFYCSSGGNAGIACATAALSLGRPATIVVPLSTTAFMVSKLKLLGVEVVQTGKHWSEADNYLRKELLAKNENGIYVPPFDHPDVWEGNGTIIDEVEKQMCDKGDYDAIVCSVGGGGLFSGIMSSLERHGRLLPGGRNIKVMAVETEGAHSLALSLERKELSKLDAITSIATSLGATQVAAKAFEWGQRPEVTSCVFDDAEAAMGAVCFADDERIVVETACGVSIATAYNGSLRSLLFPELSEEEFAKRNVVIVGEVGWNEGYNERLKNSELEFETGIDDI
ncbi:hypothetical protein G7Y89_g14772 [Cudoniella acicularis]|uniref:L-serine ammonia-lyase n=1 Tax=Cudoniella acicularis TaxID=354080 RepID=A0A8H4VQF2_9HELO|nr:hypothetical protein G7Y89_g14772 [Cudoniella acicularis]